MQIEPSPIFFTSTYDRSLLVSTGEDLPSSDEDDGQMEEGEGYPVGEEIAQREEDEEDGKPLESEKYSAW